MKSEEHLKLPGGSMAWRETAEEGRTLPPKCSRKHGSTDLHLGALLIRSSIIPFPSIKKRMNRKQKEGSQRKRGNTDSATTMTSFLCIPDYVSITVGDRVLKHLSLILLNMSNTYKYLIFTEWLRSLCTLHRATKAMIWCLISDTY